MRRFHTAFTLVLLILTLFLGAQCVRLLRRVEALQKAPATEKQSTKSEGESAKAEPDAVPAHAPSAGPERKVDRPAAPRTETLRAGDVPVAVNGTAFRMMFGAMSEAPDLQLTDEQKKARERLEADYRERARPYQEALEALDKQKEDEFRRQLTPEQLSKLNGGSNGPKPGFLGISGEDAEGGGVKITGITPNTAAAAAALKAGDVILELNSEPMPGLGVLAERVSALGAGTWVTLKIRREGAEFLQSVQLGARP